MTDSTTLPEGYFPHTINTKFQSMKALFVMYMPVPMSIYSAVKESIVSQGLEVDWKTGMIESSKMMWFGWIGLPHAYGDKVIKDDFIAYKVVGDYKWLKNAYKKVMTDFPKAHTFYNLYLTDPSVTKMEDNITYIVFKV